MNSRAGENALSVSSSFLSLSLSSFSRRRRRHRNVVSRIRRRPGPAATTTTTSSSSSLDALFDHIERVSGDFSLRSKIRVGTDARFPSRGLTLLANRALRSEEVVVSLPKTCRFFMTRTNDGEDEDEDEEDIYGWSKTAAKRLTLDEETKKRHEIWLNSLPRRAPRVPGIYMEDDEIRRWVKDHALRERLTRSIADHRQFVRECRCRSSREESELSRMRSFLQSRVFADERRRKWTAPLIDFCNHDVEANCFVRTNFGKENKQGKQATAEICDESFIARWREEGEGGGGDDDGGDDDEEYFELVVSDEGSIDVDEPLTISYANSSDESLFFEQYGFLLENGENSFLNDAESVQKFLLADSFN